MEKEKDRKKHIEGEKEWVINFMVETKRWE